MLLPGLACSLSMSADAFPVKACVSLSLKNEPMETKSKPPAHGTHYFFYPVMMDLEENV